MQELFGGHCFEQLGRPLDDLADDPVLPFLMLFAKNYLVRER